MAENEQGGCLFITPKLAYTPHSTVDLNQLPLPGSPRGTLTRALESALYV